MFVECDWWHWSPITPVGEVRTDYHDAVSDFLNTLRETSADSRLADVGLVWDVDGHRAFVATLNESWETLQQLVDSVADPKDFPEWWGVFKNLVDTDVDFDFVVPGVGQSMSPQVWVLAGRDRIGVSTLRAIVEHVGSGGHLVVTHQLPTLAHFGNAASDAEVVELVEALRSSDRVVQLVQGEDVVQRVDQLGARIYSRAGTPGVRTYSYTRGPRRDLWVVNTTNTFLDAHVQLDVEPAGFEEFSHNRHVSADDLPTPTRVDSGVMVRIPPKTVRAFRLGSASSKEQQL